MQNKYKKKNKNITTRTRKSVVICVRGLTDELDDVLLQVFFSELKYTYIESEAAYSALALMCDIGGALGLILGSTMLTFCEFADFLILLAGTWIKLRAFTGVFSR